MTDAKSKLLKAFLTWTQTHITGDEKGEAQVYLDRLFQGFGWGGLKEAGATCEKRVKKDNGGTSFADLVWKPHVVIEMKRRGTDLSKHYTQAFLYWTRLVPNRPRYAVLCNFDEFWIYDFESQLDTPVDKIHLSDLPSNYGALNFLFPGDVPPIFGNHQEDLTRKAADKLAECFNSLVARKTDRALAQRFILQMMMALFAEDIDLLEKYFVTKLLDDCKTPKDSYDLLGGLFEAMNTKGGVHGGRFKGVSYFNGGLFSDPAKIELSKEELALLRDAAKFNWSTVRPEIFGTLFEHSLDAEKRHATGAHFTSPVDIMKIVGPTILAPWNDAIESASTLGQLRKLLERIERYTVLDPACGSGNFLYVAYRELKRLEARIYDRMADEYKTVNSKQRTFGFLSARNFYGMDVNSFAVDIAKVTMMLAHKLTIDELGISEAALPLDNLEENFRAGDSLIDASGGQAPWFKADVIIGNPPFLGAKNYKRDHPAAYVNSVRKAYKQVPGMADVCVYWFRRAHDELQACTTADPFAGRAGLVGTQNIRNTASRVGGLDYIVKSGVIVDAVENQPWSGEANVNVSIVNWIKSPDKKLVPSKKRLWHMVQIPSSAKKPPRRKKGDGVPRRPYALDVREVPFISSALSDKVDVSTAKRLQINRKPQRVFQGYTPGYSGFVLDKAEADKLKKLEPSSKSLIKPYLIGRELNANGRAKRYIIDAFGLDLVALAAHPRVLDHLRTTVLPEVEAKLAAEKHKKSDMVQARAEHLDRWWTFWASRTDFRAAVGGYSRVIAASRTQREPILFHFVDPTVALGDKLQIFAFEDDYSFGILQSSVHVAWFTAKGARLKNEVDINYSSDEVFATFPWPQDASKNQVLRVADAARKLRKIRDEALLAGTGIRRIYATLQLAGKNALRDAHAALNGAVLDAYGFSAKDDICSRLLELNRALSAKERAGSAAQPPGLPVKFVKLADAYSSDRLDSAVV